MKTAYLRILVLTVLSGLNISAQTIFIEDFSGSDASDLNGTTPDTTTGGASWVASSTFKAGGLFTQASDDAGTATLSFTPSQGLVYTLDASVSGVTGDGDWIGLGFANGQSTGNSQGDRFISGNVVGTAWMLLKGDSTPTQNAALLGTGVLGGGNTGLTSNLAWDSYTKIKDPGAFDLRIVLDTTGGAGNWTSTWYAKPTATGSYSVVRSTATVLDESNFTSVGFALAGGGVNGSLESFSLSHNDGGPDTDDDGLADPWELLHFRESPDETESVILGKYDGTDDPDEDTFDNEAEESAGTDPNDPLHSPLDTDQDGYLDDWELANFSTLAYGPSDDPDGDGFTTSEELTAGTDPADGRSNPDDKDADGMADTLENSLFGDLSQGPQDDFDGDGINNLDELTVGTDPTDASDYPLVSLIPVTDGNLNTDESGYAGSAINSIAFAQNNLLTVADQQFINYYRQHASDPAHPDNQTVVVARRTLGESQWEIFPTDFQSFNINDTHNVISSAIDGDAYLHMSWGMHGNSLLYAKSDAPVTGSTAINMVSLGTAGMTGQENGVTYPKFQTLPDGDVVFLFREGGSGRGDWYLHRYDTDTDAWAPIHTNSSGGSQPLMLGRGDSPDNCFYPDRLTLGPNGMLHLAGVFRYNGDSPVGESGYQTNHRYVYLRSPDGGSNWERSDGSSIELPVVEASWFQSLGDSHVPEIVKDLAEGHSIMNESGMTTDSAGRPIIANWWADDAASGDHTRQYHILFHDGTNWQQRNVTARDIDNPATKYSEGQLSSSRMGRPVVLADADDRIIVVYNDNRFDGITVVFSLPFAQDPDRLQWTRMNLTTENLGNWETTYDEPRWRKDKVLHMLYQKLPGMGMSYTTQNNSTPVSVLEWDADAYFNSPVLWEVDRWSTPGEATVSARTRIGFHYKLKTSTDLSFDNLPAASITGDGDWRIFGTWPMDEPKRFWIMEWLEEPMNNP